MIQWNDPLMETSILEQAIQINYADFKAKVEEYYTVNNFGDNGNLPIFRF